MTGFFKDIMTRDGYTARFHRIDTDSVRHMDGQTCFDVLSYAVHEQHIGGYYIERTPETLPGTISDIAALYEGLRLLPRYAGAQDHRANTAGLTLEESEAEADRVLSEAGWTTTLKPPWHGRHVAPGLVGGRAPDGNAYAKAYAAFAQSEAAAMGLDPADHPDMPHEAAAWLAGRYKAPEQPTTASIPVDALEYRMPAYLSADQFDPQPEASETPQDETHGETGEEADGAEGNSLVHADGLDEADLHADVDAGDAESGAPDFAGEGIVEADADRPENEALDADYTLPEIEMIPPDSDPDFGAELLEFEHDTEPKEEAPTGAFIFGDNIHQLRTSAIGLVMQHALSLMPEPTDYAHLAELRNFVLGGWTDDPAKRLELDELEAAERRRNEIAEARDKKVGFLNNEATRPQIEAFDPSADWP